MLNIRYCGARTMRPGPSDEMIQRIETIEGRPAGEALGALYIDQKMTIRNLCARWTCNTRTVMRLMKWYSVIPRDPHESVALQWVGNDARRKQASDILRKTALHQAATGAHNRLGKTKDNDAGVASCARKLKANTSARRPEVREKMANTRYAMHKTDPTTHINSRAKPTAVEQMMLYVVKEWGFDAVHNYSAFPYWVDVFIPELKVGIECFHSARLRSGAWTRHAELSARGIRMLYVANRVIESGNLADLHQYITNIQVIGTNPPAQCQETVVWGCRGITLFTGYPDNITFKRTYLGGFYRLDIATSPDNEIASS